MLNDSIRVFLTVVEKKSFSKAAKALFLTQPAVSFQIQMLEEYYGTRLFDRVSRNIILTEADRLTHISEESGYLVAMKPEDYVWGSNMVVLNRGMLMVLACTLLKEDVADDRHKMQKTIYL